MQSGQTGGSSWGGPNARSSLAPDKPRIPSPRSAPLSVLAAAIGVMQQRIRFASTPDRHHQGIGDELGRHLCAHRPANDASGEQIDHRSDVKPAFRRPQVGEVCDPFAIGRRRHEGAVEHVGSDGGDLPLTQIGRQSTPARTGFESLQSHQSLDPMQAACNAFRKEIVPDPPGSVRPIAADEARANLGAELFIAAVASAARSLQPGVQSAARDTESPSHPTHGPDPPVLRNERKLHVDSFAK
jgi:hypothetical protein